MELRQAVGIEPRSDEGVSLRLSGTGKRYAIFCRDRVLRSRWLLEGGCNVVGLGGMVQLLAGPVRLLSFGLDKCDGDHHPFTRREQSR